MKKSQKKIISVWRIVLYAISVVFLAWLFYQNLVPSGILVLQHKKGDPASPISDLHPANRVIETQDNNQTFYVDPVYFDVKVPRAFEKVMIDIAWQNQSQPILELGARKVRGEFGFVLKPLQNKIIDNLSKGEGTQAWNCRRDEELIFCQKVKKYASLNKFFAQPAGRLLVYRYKPLANIKYDVMNVETVLGRYDYLIANYTAPEALGNDWYRRRLEYQWQDFALHINKISFMLSAPQLHEGHGQIVVGDIKVTLQRPPLDWEGFKEYIKYQFRRLRR